MEEDASAPTPTSVSEERPWALPVFYAASVLLSLHALVALLASRRRVPWAALYLLVGPETDKERMPSAADWALGALTQLGVSVVLARIASAPRNGQDLVPPAASMLYALHPVSVLCACTGAAPRAGLHLCIAVLVAAVSEQRPLIAAAAALLAVASDQSLAPLLFSLVGLTGVSSKALPALCVAVLAARLAYVDTSPPIEYQPALGMVWYMRAQMFPDMHAYFACLVAAQPVLLSMLLFDAYAPDTATPCVVSACTVLLFSQELRAADVVFLLALLCSQRRVFAKMARAFVPLFASALSMALSPVLLALWVDIGTLNANFLFFNGIALWLALASGIVDFVYASFEGIV